MRACSLCSPSVLTECAVMAWLSMASCPSKFSWQSGQQIVESEAAEELLLLSAADKSVSERVSYGICCYWENICAGDVVVSLNF